MGFLMNYFTKDELTEINRCLNYMIKSGTSPYSNITIELKKKTKDKIDNYCDHQDIGQDYSCTRCFACGECW